MEDLSGVGGDAAEEGGVQRIRLLAPFQQLVDFAAAFVDGGHKVRSKPLPGLTSVPQMQEPQHARSKSRSLARILDGEIACHQGLEKKLVLGGEVCHGGLLLVLSIANDRGDQHCHAGNET